MGNVMGRNVSQKTAGCVLSDHEEAVLLGDRIRDIRKYLGLSREELSSRAGISDSHFSDIENGKTNVSFYYVKKIAREMRVSVMFLCKDEVSDAALGEYIKLSMLPGGDYGYGNGEFAESGAFLLGEESCNSKYRRVMTILRGMEEDEIDIVYYGLLMFRGLIRLCGRRKHG